MKLKIMFGHYVLGEDGKTPVEAKDLIDAAQAWQQDRTVQKDKIGDITISTVFLGIDHSFDGGIPILFETMIFGGEHDEYQMRYATWDEAVEGHGVAMALVKGLTLENL